MHTQAKLVYIKVQRRESPYAGTFRGFRLMAAHPNLSGRITATGEQRPSFMPPWLVHSTGDLPRITPQLYHAYVAMLQKRYKFTKAVLWTDLEPEPFFKRK